MEEIREAALAYYANFSDEQKKSAWKFFQKMDSDGDGKISLREFQEYLRQVGLTCITDLNFFFKDLDKDGNGYLDFDEVITLYYICISGRLVFCDGCSVFLKGLYFTCVQCFKPGANRTYDLCCLCYRNKNFKHHDDAIFYDNYRLLRTKELTTSKKETLKKAISGFKLGVDIGNVITDVTSGECNTM